MSNKVITFEVENMKRKIIQIGNSWGVILPHSILELLKINPVLDELEFEVEKDILKIKK